MSSYTGVPATAATDNLPTVEEVKDKSEDDIKEFLIAKQKELNLKSEYIDKIYKQEINGFDFLDSTKEDFERWGVPSDQQKESLG
jgi:hypothetical protein